jgi:hypothetical protein
MLLGWVSGQQKTGGGRKFGKGIGKGMGAGGMLDKVKTRRLAHLFLVEFPYVCPESVLAK